MSAYDPYRFLPPQSRPAGSSLFNPNTFTPRYGSPDLDLSKPMSDTDHDHYGEIGGVEVGYEEQVEQTNGSGPSRKRARVSEQSQPQHQQREHQAVQQSRAPVASSSSKPLRPVPVSMFGIDARNDLLREIGEWLVRTCQGHNDIEIEIKLGKIINPRRGDEKPVRVRLAAASEKAVYSQDFAHSFLPDMSKAQHGTLNALLNGMVENPPDPSDRIKYKRIRQKDSFYRYGGPKVRVSELADTGEITEVIQKQKVDHLNLYCPNAPLDLRISVSTETRCEMPEGEPEDVRVKDRISYSNSICQTDLTYVTFSGPGGQPRHTFEVEVEVIDAPTLLADSQHDPDRFDKKLLSCLDTARIMIRNMPA